MTGVSATGNGCATGVKFVTEGKSLSDSRSGCSELRKADAEGRAAAASVDAYLTGVSALPEPVVATDLSLTI